jgi:Uma2 family endonuclease
MFNSEPITDIMIGNAPAFVHGTHMELLPLSPYVSVQASDIGAAIGKYLDHSPCGESFIFMPIVLPANAYLILRPAVCFYSNERWSRVHRDLEAEALNIVPDLCIEIVPPVPNPARLAKKISNYFDAGVSAVWVFHPRKKEVRAFVSSSVFSVLTAGDLLNGGAVLPGFLAAVESLFPPMIPEQKYEV